MIKVKNGFYIPKLDGFDDNKLSYHLEVSIILL